MESDPQTQPLTITIIGAGLGGLAAAFALSKHAKHIHVFERRTELSQKGSGVMLRPSAARILTSWGMTPDFEKVADNPDAVLLKDLRTGEVAMRNIAVDVSDSPDWGLPRQILQQIMYERAISQTNVTLEFGVVVEDVIDEERDSTGAKVVVRDADGKTHLHTCSLVLAADGIRSRMRSKILADLPSHTINPIVTNTTLYGIMTTRDQILGSPVTAHFADDAKLMVYMGKKTQRGGSFVVARMAQKAGQFGCLFGINPGSASETDQKGLWDEDGDVEYVKQYLEDSGGICAELKAVLDMSSHCDRWRLASMPDIPRWTNRANGGGRLVLLGDSAHAMEPNAAQGFSQIIEDIGVLELLLQRLHLTPDTRRNMWMPLADLTAHWQTLRKPRAERIKAYAAWNTRMFLGEPLAPQSGNDRRNVKSLRDVQPEMYANFHSSAFIKWAHDWDVVAEANRYVDALVQGDLEGWQEQEENRRGSRRMSLTTSKI